VLLSEAAFLDTPSNALNKIIKKIKTRAVYQDINIPVVATLSEGRHFLPNADISVDDFIRIGQNNDDLFLCLKRFDNIRGLLWTFQKEKINFYPGQKATSAKANIAAIKYDNCMISRLESLGFNVFEYLPEDKPSNVYEQDLACLVLSYNHIFANIRKYANFIDKLPKDLSVLIVGQDFNNSLALSNKLNCEYFCSQYSDLELKKRISSLSLYRKIRLKLCDCLSKNIELTLRDPLTEAYNRRFVDNYSSRFYPQNGAFICLLDVDNFKRINDKYGHNVGDKILRQLSLTITKSVRDTDFVCRYGGDEFILIMPDIDLKEANKIVQRTKNNISSQNFCQNNNINLSVSFGVSHYISGSEIQNAIEKADEELKNNKMLLKTHSLDEILRTQNSFDHKN
jgi:diguanylate cyclase (GGDEF)-like protein